MSVATEICATAYEGNGSTSTPYLVPWPFLDASHIKVGVRLGEEGDLTTLGDDEYTVLTDGDNPRVTTAVAYDDSYQVVVYRDTPRLQPTEYPTGDPFPAASHEAALDRVTMVAQEIARDAGLGGVVIPSPGEDGEDGAGYGGTSASSVAIGTGSKSFTTQAGLAYVAGSRIRLASDADPVNDWMEGVVTAYSGVTLQVSVDTVSGSGTHADWNLSVGGTQGQDGSNGADGEDGEDADNSLHWCHEAPVNKTYPVVLHSNKGGTITGVVTKTSSGSLTANFRKNGSSIGGLGAVSVTTSKATTPTDPVPGVAFAVGDTIDVVVSGASSPLDFQFSLLA